MSQATEQGTILFDGVCHFCDASINFIYAHDKLKYFRFAPLQSIIGKNLRKQFGLENVDSVILIEHETAYTRSTAALKIARRLRFPWSLVYVFIFVPRSVRDFAYDLFSSYRYRLFGKKNVCTLPTPEMRERFLDLC